MVVIKSRGAPTIGTPATVGTVYIDQDTDKVYKCVDVRVPGVKSQFITVYALDIKTEYVWERVSDAEAKTYLLVDETGNEVPATLVEETTVFTATANDIRLGAVAATDDGVTVGEKEIPAYYTSEGSRVVTSGSRFTLPVDLYDYTKIIATICTFNTDLSDSMAVEKVAINGYVYPVQSATYESEIIKDSDNQRIDFGITNDSDSICLIRYILYKEIY